MEASPLMKIIQPEVARSRAATPQPSVPEEGYESGGTFEGVLHEVLESGATTSTPKPHGAGSSQGSRSNTAGDGSERDSLAADGDDESDPLTSGMTPSQSGVLTAHARLLGAFVQTSPGVLQVQSDVSTTIASTQGVRIEGVGPVSVSLPSASTESAVLQAPVAVDESATLIGMVDGKPNAQEGSTGRASTSSAQLTLEFSPSGQGIPLSKILTTATQTDPVQASGQSAKGADSDSLTPGTADGATGAGTQRTSGNVPASASTSTVSPGSQTANAEQGVVSTTAALREQLLAEPAKGGPITILSAGTREAKGSLTVNEEDTLQIRDTQPAVPEELSSSERPSAQSKVANLLGAVARLFRGEGSLRAGHAAGAEGNETVSSTQGSNQSPTISAQGTQTTSSIANSATTASETVLPISGNVPQPTSVNESEKKDEQSHQAVAGRQVSERKSNGSAEAQVQEHRVATLPERNLESASLARVTLNSPPETIMKSGSVPAGDTKALTTALPTPLPPEMGQSVIDQIMKGVALQVRGGVSEMRVHLEPPSLGDVVVQVRMENGHMEARIDVTQAAVKSVLEASLPQLRQELMDRGITVQRLDISLDRQTAGNDGRSNQEGQKRGQGNRRHEAVESLEQYHSGRLLGYNTIEVVI